MKLSISFGSSVLEVRIFLKTPSASQISLPSGVSAMP
jgi:hypothetical protein